MQTDIKFLTYELFERQPCLLAVNDDWTFFLWWSSLLYLQICSFKNDIRNLPWINRLLLSKKKPSNATTHLKQMSATLISNLSSLKMITKYRLGQTHFFSIYPTFKLIPLVSLVVWIRSNITRLLDLMNYLPQSIVIMQMSSLLCLPLFFNKFAIMAHYLTTWNRLLSQPFTKKGCISSLYNYRLISLTCITCKNMEHIVLSNYQ